MTKINSLSRPLLAKYLSEQDRNIKAVVVRAISSASKSTKLVGFNSHEMPLKTIFYKEGDDNIIAVFPEQEKIDYDHTFFECFTKSTKNYICNRYLIECCTIAVKQEYNMLELQLCLMGYVMDIVNENLETPRTI